MSAPPIVSRHPTSSSFQSQAPAVPAHKTACLPQSSIHMPSSSVRNLNSVVTHSAENTYGELVSTMSVSKNIDQSSNKNILAPKRLKDLSAPPLPPRKSVSPSSDVNRPVPALPSSSSSHRKQQLVANVQPNVKQSRDLPPIQNNDEKNCLMNEDFDRVHNNGNRSPLSNASSMINLSFQNSSQSSVPKKSVTNLLDIGRPNISSSRSSEDLTKFPMNQTILSGTVFDFRHVTDPTPFSDRSLENERKSSLGNQSGESNLMSVITGSTETISGIIDTRYEVLPPHKNVNSIPDPRMFSKPLLNKHLPTSSQQPMKPLPCAIVETRLELNIHNPIIRQDDVVPQKSVARIQPMQNRLIQQLPDSMNKQYFDGKHKDDKCVAHYENVNLDGKGMIVSMKKQQMPPPVSISDSSSSCNSSGGERINPLTHNAMGQKLDDNSGSNVPYENINFEYINRLVSEGYPKDSVVRALGITRNDIEMACDILHEFATKTVKCQNNNGDE